MEIRWLGNTLLWEVLTLSCWDKPNPLEKNRESKRVLKQFQLCLTWEFGLKWEFSELEPIKWCEIRKVSCVKVISWTSAIKTNFTIPGKEVLDILNGKQLLYYGWFSQEPLPIRLGTKKEPIRDQTQLTCTNQKTKSLAIKAGSRSVSPCLGACGLCSRYLCLWEGQLQFPTKCQKICSLDFGH